jgi:MarR family transcriptional regulator, transcriptional regulator for hemolysin
MISLNEPSSTPLHFLFSRLSKAYLGALVSRLEGRGPAKYFSILLLIHRSGETLTQQELANQLKVDKTSIVRVVDYLSKAGFITRKRNPKDRRQQLLQLTSKARAVMPVIEQCVTEINRQAFKRLNEKEKKQFYALLERVYNNLSSYR